jgi:GT2 family glycosyltransferase
MLSLIICSRNQDLLTQLKENIHTTIRCEYELIIIDNSHNTYSIFEAYNEGVKRARYAYLCFMHEDVLFHTLNWGNKLISHFHSDNSVGLIGVVGTHFMPKTLSYWCDTTLISGRLIQGQAINNEYTNVLVEHTQYTHEKNFIEAAAIDGFWFAIKRDLFNDIAFDEKLYKGFHFYDMDISMQVTSINYKIIIVMDILIEHFSYGNGGPGFRSAQKLFFKKWNGVFPVIKGIHLSGQEVQHFTNSIIRRKRNQNIVYKFFKRVYLFLTHPSNHE